MSKYTVRKKKVKITVNNNKKQSENKPLRSICDVGRYCEDTQQVWPVLSHLRSCQRQWGRTRWGSHWWCSWPPGWSSPQLRPRPTRTWPAAPQPRRPPPPPPLRPLRRPTAATCRSPCPGSGPSSVGQVEQRTPVRACILHHPAEEAGRETKETWSSGRRPRRRAQSRFGPVFTASILRSSAGANSIKSSWFWDFPGVADLWQFPWLN